MNTKLVEITEHEDGWKGTWYKTGQRHFVQQNKDWPRVMVCRWNAGNGGILDQHCRVVRGPFAWLRCAWRDLVHNAQVTGASNEQK